MKQVYISELSKHIGKEVVVRGWLYNNRSSGKIQFMQIRDGSGIVQCVASPKDIGEESFKACDKLSQESSLSVTGIVREDKRAPGGYEITLNKVEIHHVAQAYPIALQAHGVGFLMEQRHYPPFELFKGPVAPGAGQDDEVNTGAPRQILSRTNEMLAIERAPGIHVRPVAPSPVL